MDAKRISDFGKVDFSGYDLTLDISKLITPMIEEAIEEGIEESPPYITVMNAEDDLMIRVSLGFMGLSTDIGPTWEFSLFDTVLDYTLGTEIEDETIDDAKAALASIRAVASKLDDAIKAAELTLSSS